MLETDDITQEILTDSDGPFYTISKSIPQQFSQQELNDHVRDLGLSKHANVNFYVTRKGSSEQNHKSFLLLKSRLGFCGIFCKEEYKFVYSHNISALLQKLGILLYNPNDFRLFEAQPEVCFST